MIGPKNVKDIGQRIPDMTNTSSLINRICELTYKNKIENLLNLLLIVWAKNTFPETIKKYDTIDLVFSTLYEDALSRVNRMPFHADNLEDVSIALYIAEKYKDDLPLPFEVAADKILSEIGLRYSTAEQLLDE